MVLTLPAEIRKEPQGGWLRLSRPRKLESLCVNSGERVGRASRWHGTHTLWIDLAPVKVVVDMGVEAVRGNRSFSYRIYCARPCSSSRGSRTTYKGPRSPARVQARSTLNFSYSKMPASSAYKSSNGRDLDSTCSKWW